jgi:hypothetical protein
VTACQSLNGIQELKEKEAAQRKREGKAIYEKLRNCSDSVASL